jgi:hypothetical protein
MPRLNPRTRCATPLVLGLAALLAGCDPLSLSSLFQTRSTGASILTLLDTDGRKLEVGEEMGGALSTSDFTGVNDGYLEAWSLKARSGQKLWVDLMSDDFDSYLYIVGPGISDPLRDDDSGGACNARVEFSVLESGVFSVIASSSGSRQAGTYRLRVSDEPLPAVTRSCGGVDGSALSALATPTRVLEWDTPAVGFLAGGDPSIEQGRPVHVWTLQGVAGQRATIRLESDDYDAFLYFFGPGMNEALTDDDGGAGTDSELTVTFPASGTFTVGAAALSSGSTGSYTLVVQPPLDLATLPTEGRQLRSGSVVEGVLRDGDLVVEGQPSQAWSFQARAGQVATIDLISEDFDSYLRIFGPGLSMGLSDDDSAGDLDSRIEVSFPQDGVYRVIASSLGGSTGRYTLRVR